MLTIYSAIAVSVFLIAILLQLVAAKAPDRAWRQQLQPPATDC